MEEPSVLDYLKSKLNPWSKEKIELPSSDDPAHLPEPSALEPLPLPSARPSLKLGFGPLPWRSLLALALGLTGQSFLEPPAPQPIPALAFYMVAFLFLAWAFWRAEWILPEYQPQSFNPDEGAFRKWAFLAAWGLGLAAFALMGGNRFTGLNVTLWLAATGLFVYSLWIPKMGLRQRWLQIRDFLTRGSWNLRITPWLILLTLVWSVAIFYRFYNLDTVPAEPFSDHAEKLMDVYDLSQGETKIFFERNTGREFFQMYLTLAVNLVFGTGLSFFALKLGTALAGFFTLPYLYLLGKELFNKRVGLLALALTAVAYWPNVISRVGLRFPLYPLFAAPVLFYLLRGLRTQNRNDFILAGLFLGLGLHGYSSFRFMPIFVIIAVAIYLLHVHGKQIRQQTILSTGILALSAFFLFIPLLRFTLENPQIVLYRSLTRLAETEQPIPGNPILVFFDNLKNAMLMFNWNNGKIWVHSVISRPALDVVAAALLVFGYSFLLLRYLRQRDWRDLLLVLSVPLLMMPSILSLAFPLENPSLNRTGGAYIVVFIIVAFALDALYQGFRKLGWQAGAVSLITLLVFWSALLNYELVFNKYAYQFRYSAWNTSDIADVIRSFVLAGNSPSNAWVLPYPHWIDTRLVGAWLGEPMYNPVLWPDQVGDTVYLPGNKIYFIKENDSESINLLRETYPQGALSLYQTDSELIGKNFWVFTVPDTSIQPASDSLQP